MPTGLTLNAGTGGSDLAKDSVGGFVYQYVKHAYGGDGTATLVTTSNRFPVEVTGTGTLAVQVDGAALTALQLIDDPVVTLGSSTYSEATTKGFVVGAVRNDTLAALADTDNELAPLQVNATGALYVDASATTVPTSVPGPAGTAQTTRATSASLAPGGSVDLDSDQITSSTTAHLVGLISGCSVATKLELKTVLNGVASSALATFFTRAGETPMWSLPRAFFTQAESATAGLDAFRVSVTNLDPTATADVYATFLYDEV